MTEAKSLPLGVPAFKPLKAGVPLPPNLESNIQSMVHKKQMEVSQNAINRKATVPQFPTPNLTAANLTFIQTQLANQNHATKRKDPMVISPQANAFKVPAFQALPSSVSRISTGQIVHANSNLAKMGANQISAISRADVSTANGIDDVCVLDPFQWKFSFIFFDTEFQREKRSQRTETIARSGFEGAHG